MYGTHDNWERLVAAVLKKEQLWQLCHDQSRSPSILSEASSDISSSFNLSSPLPNLAASSSTYRQQPIEEAVAESQELFPKLVLLSDFSPAFDAEDVSLASAVLFGRGTFGSAYTAAMGNGVKIVVKRLKSVSISGLEFKRHMEIVGNVGHENVAPLRAYYSSKDEGVMLYDYYNKGSVFALLYGQIGESLVHVNWEHRLRIALGAARGIAEIHTHNGGKLVHGNIKSSNIFLNSQQYGYVSDLGVASMIATKFTSTAWCYAPEVKNTQNASQASDVYSFGILLLELLTRKSPVHVPGGPKAVNLVKLLNSVISRKMTAEVFDAVLLKNPTIRGQMVKVLQMGLICVAKSPKQRPRMSEVVKMLEDLGMMNIESIVSLERKLVFVDDGYPTFSLEEMLKAPADFLGQGTFGISHKARIDIGKTITVKRLWHVKVTFKEFQQHMEIIGRMRHENVAKLRAYCFSEEDVILVYDYYKLTSVSALLHGKLGAHWITLTWETRLKIAVGAARGIAHIHRQDGGKFAHGNIKSSNIFINEQQYGIVSDVGLAKLMSQFRWPVIQTPEYCAPEIQDSGRVSQASDVYSFGVVLLKLLTGRPSLLNMDGGDVISLVNWIQSVRHNNWTAGVFDLELLRNTNDMVKMMQVLQIAMDCVAVVPERRPKMVEVVKSLEEISGVDSTDGQPSIESRLQDLLEDLFWPI